MNVRKLCYNTHKKLTVFSLKFHFISIELFMDFWNLDVNENDLPMRWERMSQNQFPQIKSFFLERFTSFFDLFGVFSSPVLAALGPSALQK